MLHINPSANDGNVSTVLFEELGESGLVFAQAAIRMYDRIGDKENEMSVRKHLLKLYVIVRKCHCVDEGSQKGINVTEFSQKTKLI